MKKKISLMLAGLGLCASVMLMLPKEAESQTKEVSNSCYYVGGDCNSGCMGCICGGVVITTDSRLLLDRADGLDSQKLDDVE